MPKTGDAPREARSRIQAVQLPKISYVSSERRVALTLNCQRAFGPASFVFTVVQPPCAWFDDSRSLKLLKSIRQRDNTRRFRAVPFVQALSIIFHAELCSKRNPSLPAKERNDKKQGPPRRAAPHPFAEATRGEWEVLSPAWWLMECSA